MLHTLPTALHPSPMSATSHQLSVSSNHSMLRVDLSMLWLHGCKHVDGVWTDRAAARLSAAGMSATLVVAARVCPLHRPSAWSHGSKPFDAQSSRPSVDCCTRGSERTWERVRVPAARNDMRRCMSSRGVRWRPRPGQRPGTLVCTCDCPQSARAPVA